RLQGGLEPAYRAHEQYAGHLIREGWAHLRSHEYARALDCFETADAQFGKIVEQIPWRPKERDGMDLEVAILQGLGASHEALGSVDEALANYDAASMIIGGSGANYRAAVLVGD